VAGGANTYTLGAAASVSMHADYKGFGNCPAAVTDPEAFCINDDIAVITLAQAAPDWMKRYDVASSMPGMGTALSHVGFGTTGDGVAGHTAGSASFFVKRTGQGFADRPLDELNDEQNFAGAAEVWSSDFDSAARGIDTHCTMFGVCSGVLANNVETTLGGGDSGGPSFMQTANGQWVLVGNNTFGPPLLRRPGRRHLRYRLRRHDPRNPTPISWRRPLAAPSTWCRSPSPAPTP
jgi:hypothetical protein